MIKEIYAKTLLSSSKIPDPYFGIKYTLNIYRGCQHKCIYCDSRSKCYQVNNFEDDIEVKVNAIELLTKELKNKRVKGTVGTGSMNDPYMPIEKERKLTRKVLETIKYYKFPVHIITKGTLVTRDIDILKEINKVYAAVSFTITTYKDDLSRKIEPFAPKTSERLKTLTLLSTENIYTGVTLMPLLPYINTELKNVENILNASKENGAKYIIPFFGLTLREGSREYFYKKLDEDFSDLKEKYIHTFGEKYECLPDNYQQLYDFVKNWSIKNNMPLKMNFYKNTQENISQINLFE